MALSSHTYFPDWSVSESRHDCKLCCCGAAGAESRWISIRTICVEGKPEHYTSKFLEATVHHAFCIINNYLSPVAQNYLALKLILTFGLLCFLNTLEPLCPLRQPILEMLDVPLQAAQAFLSEWPNVSVKEPGNLVMYLVKLDHSLRSLCVRVT